jgi:hypothetical protein
VIPVVKNGAIVPKCKRLSENLSDAIKAYFAILEKSQLAKGDNDSALVSALETLKWRRWKTGKSPTGAKTARSDPPQGRSENGAVESSGARRCPECFL